MNFKRIISILLTGSAVLSAAALTGCNKNKGPVYSKRTNVYAETALSTPESVDWVQFFATTDDRYYLAYNKMVEVEVSYDGEGFYEDYYTPMPYLEVATEAAVIVDEPAAAAETEATADMPALDDDFAVDEDMMVEVDTDTEEEYPSDGETYTEIRYQTWIYSNNYEATDPADFHVDFGTPEGYVQSMFTDDKGNVYIMYNRWIYPEDGTEAYNTYTVYQIDGKTGSILGEKDLGAILQADGVDPNDMYVNSVSYSNDCLVISVQTNLYIVDMASDAVLAKYESGNWIDRIALDGNNIYFTTYLDVGGYGLFSVDMKTGEGTRLDTENLKSVVSYGCCGARDGVIYFQDSGGINYWDSKTDTAGELINYLNSDVDSTYINTIQVLPDGRIFYSGTIYEEEKNKVLVSVLDRIPDENMQEEIIITIASVYESYELRRAAIRFNKQNTGVRIAMKNYQKYNTEENEYTGAVTQLNADITMGNVPDILMIDSQLPAESYFNKDVFVDLNKYIDDPEVGLNRSDFYENLLNLTNVNGELYTLIPRFNLKTLAAKTKYVGSEPGWTITEMLETIKKMPEGMEAFSYDYDRAVIQNFLIESCGSTFVDWENATTHFDSKEFIDLIEFLKSCPEKSLNTQHNESIDYDDYDYQAEEEYWNNYTMRFYRDEALFQDTNIWDLNEITYLMQNFASDVTMIGYPTNDEGSSGAIIVPLMEMGICTASPNHDSAWSFLRFMMTDDSNAQDAYSLSINKVFMEKKLAESEEIYGQYFYEYTEEDLKWYEENYSAEYVEYLKNSRIRYTKEHGQKVLDILTSATRVQRSDSELSRIINEELSYFYGGTRDAATTADVINNIANLYVTENS
ncbi:MAG: hypothetical protein E7658_06855 [Ruminococcaceae bacterium]|nr:hypothetical protein [Oscillospiraceae bacterium]